MRSTVLLTTPLAVLVGLERPAALFALLLLAAFVAAVARVGLWLLDDVVAGDRDAHTARAGLGAFAAGTTFGACALLFGPLSALLVVPATLLVALWFRPGRGSSILPMPPVERPAGER